MFIRNIEIVSPDLKARSHTHTHTHKLPIAHQRNFNGRIPINAGNDNNISHFCKHQCIETLRAELPSKAFDASLYYKGALNA